MERIDDIVYGHIVIGNNMSRVLDKSKYKDRHIFWDSKFAPELFDNDCQIACINHYNLKTLQFWRDKQLRGNAFTNLKHPISEWYEMNKYCNDRVDTFARDWFHHHDQISKMICCQLQSFTGVTIGIIVRSNKQLQCMMRVIMMRV